jgi:membrane protein DedA with SNARE-associated domain
MRLMLLTLAAASSPVPAGYVYGAVFGATLLQSMGIPFPAVAILIAAAIDASADSAVSLPVVIGAAVLGGLIGSSAAYLIGSRMGERLLGYLWRHQRISERKMKLGIYLLEEYDWQMLVLGRFVSVIRPLQGYLAGSVRLKWQMFLLFTAIGLGLWASVYAVGAYLFGSNFPSLGDTAAATVILVLIAVGLIYGAVQFYRGIGRLEAAAERAMPGPLTSPLHLPRSAEVNHGGAR